MPPFRTLLRPFALAAALLFGAAAAHAGVGGVHDNGAFFSEPARAEASRIIGDVERGLKKDVVVETYNEIPESAKGGANLSDKTAANQFFQQWAGQQARQQEVNGVYILLVKKPAHLQVVVGNQTLKQAFTARDRETLVANMLGKLRAKENDAALLEGVNFVASTMRAHATGSGQGAATARGGAQESMMGWLLPVLIGGVVLWVVFGLLRSLFGGRANPVGDAAGAGGAGGGGFGRSLLGGLFGAAAGMWMYDQFFGSHGHASPPTDTTGAGDGGHSGHDTDYTSSGGGFGDDSGGGDFGGGDSGGGDF